VFTGRVTARTHTTISMFDKEIVTIALDERTSVVPWIREKPFVRKPVTLEPSAITVGALVRVKVGTDHSLAEVVELANDVQTRFEGRLIETSASAVTVFDKHMALVTLGIDRQTRVEKLFLVKPFVRKPVYLAVADLKVGTFIKLFPSKTSSGTASLVEAATDEPLVVPAPLPKAGN
jgi:hypothetical protein